MIKIHSNQSVLIKDLQKTDAYNPFSEESQKVIHNLGNVEYFELCETSSKDPVPPLFKALFDTYRVHQTIDRREIRHLIHPVLSC